MADSLTHIQTFLCCSPAIPSLCNALWNLAVCFNCCNISWLFDCTWWVSLVGEECHFDYARRGEFHIFASSIPLWRMALMANLITSVNTKTSTNTTVHFLPRCAVVTRVFCPERPKYQVSSHKCLYKPAYCRCHAKGGNLVLSILRMWLWLIWYLHQLQKTFYLYMLLSFRTARVYLINMHSNMVYSSIFP